VISTVIPVEVLTVLPGCEDGRPPISIRALPGGRGCNSVRRIDTSAGRFVLRQRHDPVNRPGSRALDEISAQRMAASAGLAPQIIAAAADGCWLLMEFVEGPLWTEERLQSRSGLELLGQKLAAFHALDVPAGTADVDAPAMAHGYMQQIAQRDPALTSALAGQLQRVAALSCAIADLSSSRAINHGDLHASNIIGSGPLLIDWEYTQCADPTYDIACLLTYYPSLEAQRDLLLGAASLTAAADRTMLALQRERFACLNRLWSHANGMETG
jgi:aminoglycoside phosphotransferase (APT) family kinase protein